MSSLPPEIYSDVLGYIPPLLLQKTTHSLSVAIPYYSDYLCHHHLFQHINLSTAGQVIRLYLHLRAHPHRIANIQTLTLSSWSVDADVLANVIKLVPDIQEMTLHIGINFAPEHLDEIFKRPMMSLKFLGLRFRPYVERATYLQFLKGTYFDTLLKLLSSWPPSGIPTISIIQDPLGGKFKDNNKQFAQPLVFFRLDSFVSLATSPYGESVTSFRLRIPSRQAARHLYTCLASFPSLDLLDLSTCNVLEADVDELLVRFTTLRHLIVDECNILRGEWREGDWAALGKNCALAGSKRAKARQKKITEWLAVNTVIVEGVETMLVNQIPAKKVKKGRRGLATSTITLRQKKMQVVPMPVAGPGPGPGAKPTPGPPAEGADSGRPQKIRMLPSLPTLTSFSTTLHSSIGEEKHQMIRREFHSGWKMGLAQLSAVRKRAITSWMNGTRIVREDEDSLEKGEAGLEGLTDLLSGDEDLIALDADQLLELCPCPVLCFAGSPLNDEHTLGCGHLVNTRWNIWDSE